MNNFIQSECEREIKKVTRTIIILITLNICPIYAGGGLFSLKINFYHLMSKRSDLNNFWSKKVIVGVSVCTNYELIIWCTVPFSILYNIIGGVRWFLADYLLKLKEGCFFPMLIWPEFRMRQFRDDNHREGAPHFMSPALNAERTECLWLWWIWILR